MDPLLDVGTLTARLEPILRQWGVKQEPHFTGWMHLLLGIAIVETGLGRWRRDTKPPGYGLWNMTDHKYAQVQLAHYQKNHLPMLLPGDNGDEIPGVRYHHVQLPLPKRDGDWRTLLTLDVDYAAHMAIAYLGMKSADRLCRWNARMKDDPRSGNPMDIGYGQPTFMGWHYWQEDWASPPVEGEGPTRWQYRKAWYGFLYPDPQVPKKLYGDKVVLRWLTPGDAGECLVFGTLLGNNNEEGYIADGYFVHEVQASLYLTELIKKGPENLQLGFLPTKSNPTTIPRSQVLEVVKVPKGQLPRYLEACFRYYDEHRNPRPVRTLE